MEEKFIDSQKIKQNAWKQGACLSINTPTEVFVDALSLQNKLPQGLYIVLSQDCDILQASLQKEPVVEIIRANRIEAMGF